MTTGKIIRAWIESFRGVKDQEIDLEGKNVLAFIADGGQGKTSWIRFFKAGLSGTIENEDINDDTGKAAGGIEVQVDEDRFAIRFHKTLKAETVEIKNLTTNMKAPKTELRRILGAVVMEPFKLARLKPAEQVLEFKKMLRIDTAELTKKINAGIKEREMIGREKKNLDGAIKNDPNNKIDFEVHRKKYENELPLGDKPEKLAKAIEHNALVAVERERLAGMMLRIADCNDAVAEIDRKIAELLAQKEQKLSQIEADQLAVEEKDKWISENPEKPIAEMQKEIDEINEFNRERLSLQEYFGKQEQLKIKTKEWEEKDAEVKALEDEREEVIKKAVSMLPGLEILEPKLDAEGQVIDSREGAYYNGVRLSNLSTTEAVDFSVSLKRAIDAQEGKSGLPVMIVDDADLVGSIGIDKIKSLLATGKYQAIVTLVEPKIKEVRFLIKNELGDYDEMRKEATEEGKKPIRGTKKTGSAENNAESKPAAKKAAKVSKTGQQPPDAEDIDVDQLKSDSRDQPQ